MKVPELPQLYFFHGKCCVFLSSQSICGLSLLKSLSFSFLKATAVVDADLSQNFRVKLHWVTEASGTEASPDVTSWLQLSIGRKKNNVTTKPELSFQLYTNPFNETKDQNNELKKVNLIYPSFSINITIVSNMVSCEWYNLYNAFEHCITQHSRCIIWISSLTPLRGRKAPLLTLRLVSIPNEEATV